MTKRQVKYSYQNPRLGTENAEHTNGGSAGANWSKQGEEIWAGKGGKATGS
jgi:hypothetical protein